MAASLRLVVLWGLLSLVPLALGGLAQDLPGPARQPALEWVFSGCLVLLAALPALWFSLGAGRDDWRHPLREAALLGAVSLPALTLAWPYAAVEAAHAAVALGYLALLLGGCGVAIAWGPSVRRATAVALALLATLGLPVVCVMWEDLLGAPPPVLPHLSPTVVVAGLLSGASVALPVAVLVGGLALALAAPRLGRLRARRVAPVVGAAALALAALAPVQGDEARPLLGDRVRPGEPYPLVLDAPGVPAGELVAARSFATRYAAPVGGPVVLSGTPLGGGYRLELDREAEPWARLQVDLPEPTPVRERELLVGLLGSGARGLAERLGLKTHLVELELESLRALAVAGEALDVVVAGAGAAVDPYHAAYLRAWVGCGGVLVVDAPADLERVAGSWAAARADGDDDWLLQSLGAGALVGSRGDRLSSLSALPAPPQVLGQRLRERARRRALTELSLDAPPPTPSVEVGRNLALAALGLALVWLLLGLLARRLDPATVTGGGVLIGVALALALRAALAPASPVIASTIQVLELPAGGQVARRLEILTLAAPRRVEARVRLQDRSGAGPPRPIFLSPVSAVRARALLVAGPAGPLLEFPASPSPRTFLRHDAIPLEGALTLGEGGVDNATGLALEALVRVSAAGVSDVSGGDAEPLSRWRVGGGDWSERRWRALAAAALTGRDLRVGDVLLGRIDPLGPRVVSGVGEERRQAGVLVVPLR